MENGQELLLTDTVGFISKLPHHLIDAFRSTLEEARYADFLIHIVDSSDPEADAHCKIVYETLHSLAITGKPILTVWNKCDLPGPEGPFSDPQADLSIRFSAKTGEGKDTLFAALDRLLRESRVHIQTLIPFREGGKLSLIRKYGQLLSEEYAADGILIEAYVPGSLAGLFFEPTRETPAASPE